ncbi:MAG: hypothetical protein AAGD10_11870 [Myxococcota bacterium]
MSRSRRFRTPRRAIPTRPGVFALLAPLILGVAGVTAGNNLLFLILGATLGSVVLSGVISERAIKRVEVDVRPVGPIEAGAVARLNVRFRRPPGGMGLFGLCVFEMNGLGLFPRKTERLLYAGVPFMEGTEASTRCRRAFEERGRPQLGPCEVSTTFPFGLLRKTREIELRMEGVVWPRRVELPSVLSDARADAANGAPVPLPGMGTEILGVRERRDGENVRRLHALRSAFLDKDIVIESTREQQSVAWVGVDARPGVDPEALNRACELAAAILRDRSDRERPLGLVTPSGKLGPAPLPVLLDRLGLLGPEVPLEQELPPALWLLPDGSPSRPDGWRVDGQGELHRC